MIEFENKTYKNILDNQLKRVPDTLDKREGSIIQTALGPVSWYLEGVYLDLDAVQKNVYAGTAGGESLDRIAYGYGITRKPATHAVRTGVFNMEISAGTRFSALLGQRHVVYEVVEYTRKLDNLYHYKLRCELPGEIGNEYTGRIVPIDYISGLSSAELAGIVEGGSDEEPDEDLRERILIKIQKPSTSGNRYDYYNWAMECAGVGAAKVFPLSSGPGTVKVVIADANISAADAALVTRVQEHIEELRPIGADVTVASVKEKAVNVSASIRLRLGLNLGAVQSSFQKALADYLRKEALDMSYLSLARVGNLLLGTAGVEDYSGLLLNGVSENIGMAEEEIAVAGNVTLEVM